MKPYYADDLVTLYCADARDALAHVGRVDLVLTDPPYGIGEARGKNKTRGLLAAPRDYGTSDWDDAPPPQWLLEWTRDISTHQIIFGGNFFTLPPGIVLARVGQGQRRYRLR